MGHNKGALASMLAPAIEAIHPPEAMKRQRRTDLAIGQDGRATVYALGSSLGHLVASWYLTGSQVVGNTQNIEHRIAADGTLERFDVKVKTAPVGADLKIRLNQNGISLGTATITDGELIGSLSLDEACNAGDLLTIDVTQIGSTTAGSNLSAFATYREERGA
jgi:hypothetical protein